MVCAYKPIRDILFLKSWFHVSHKAVRTLMIQRYDINEICKMKAIDTNNIHPGSIFTIFCYWSSSQGA